MSGNTKKTTIRHIQVASVGVALLATLGFTGLVGTAGYLGNEAKANSPGGQTTLSAPGQSQLPGTANPTFPRIGGQQRRSPAAVVPRTSQTPRIRSRGS